MVEEEVPYEWPVTSNVPTEVLQLWTEVENGLEKSQTGALARAGQFFVERTIRIAYVLAVDAERQ